MQPTFRHIAKWWQYCYEVETTTKSKIIIQMLRLRTSSHHFANALVSCRFCPTTKKRQMRKEAEKYVRHQNVKSQNEKLSNDEKILISMLCEFSKLQVKKKKQSIVRIAKKYRRYESGIDKNGFVYISQLEAICR